ALAGALARLRGDVRRVHGDLAAALALAGVLPRATLGGLAAAHALARVLALTDVDVRLRGLLVRGRRLLVREGFGARHHSGNDGAHHLAELSPVHAFFSLTKTKSRTGEQGSEGSYPTFQGPCQDRQAC